MTEEPNTTQGEEPEICSVDSLQKVCEKYHKLLLISVSKERKDFIKKFMDEATPKDLDVVAVETGGPCEIVEKLGMKDTSTAVLVVKGEIKAKINLVNDDVRDAVGLMKMLSEDKKGRVRKKQ